MLTTHGDLPLDAVVLAAGSFSKRADQIAKSVASWAEAAFSTDFFLQSVGGLKAKVEVIGDRAAGAGSLDGISSSQLRRLCVEVQRDLAYAYVQVVQNAAIDRPSDERFFLDHLGVLEGIWCAPDTPLYALHTQDRGLVDPELIEALPLYSRFIEALGKFSTTFAKHPVSCFLSFAQYESGDLAAMIQSHLAAAGIQFKGISEADYIVVLGSAQYGEDARATVGSTVRDQALTVVDVHATTPIRVVRVLVGGTVLRSFPKGMTQRSPPPIDLRETAGYFSGVVEVLERLHGFHGNQVFITASKALFSVKPVLAKRPPPVVAKRPSNECQRAYEILDGLKGHIVKCALSRFGELSQKLEAVRAELLDPTGDLEGRLDKAYKMVESITAGQPSERRALFVSLANLEKTLFEQAAPLFDRYCLALPIPGADDVTVDRRALRGLIKELKPIFSRQGTTCFIDCADEALGWVSLLQGHLEKVGIGVTVHATQQVDLSSTVAETACKAERATVVLMVGTASYPAHLESEAVITNKLLDRMEGGVYRLVLQGSLEQAFNAASSTRQRPWCDCRNPEFYLVQLRRILTVIQKRVG